MCSFGCKWLWHIRIYSCSSGLLVILDACSSCVGIVHKRNHGGIASFHYNDCLFQTIKVMGITKTSRIHLLFSFCLLGALVLLSCHGINGRWRPSFSPPLPRPHMRRWGMLSIICFDPTVSMQPRAICTSAICQQLVFLPLFRLCNSSCMLKKVKHTTLTTLNNAHLLAAAQILRQTKTVLCCWRVLKV